ncbi:hypothetical protein G6F65_015447 [Rhizopus arrhizus]|nr:hypothetical protein G6F65_015447 [Rhizopus arrhizus]
MIGDEGRLDQGVLDGGFEDLQHQLAPAVGRLDLDLQALAMAQQRLTIGAVGGGDLRVVVAPGFVHAPAAERRAQVDLRAVPLHFGGAVDSAGDVTDHAFGQVHDLVVRGIGLVQLHHGEFRVVPGADAFVAEVAVDLVHALQATHGQALEVQLRRHAQVQVQVQRVVVGGERLGRCAAGDVMHHRRLDFQEVAVVEPRAHGADDLRALDEDRARFRGHDQVDVALAVTLLDVGQAVPLVRQRAQRLGQQADRFGLDRQLAGFGTGQAAFDGDDVTDIPALEGRVGIAEHGALQEQLDAAGLVLDLREAGLAHDPLGHQTAGHLHLAAVAFQGLGGPLFGIGEFFLQPSGKVLAAEVVRVRDALPTQRFEFLTALGDQLVFVDGGGIGSFAHGSAGIV